MVKRYGAQKTGTGSTKNTEALQTPYMAVDCVPGAETSSVMPPYHKLYPSSYFILTPLTEKLSDHRKTF